MRSSAPAGKMLALAATTLALLTFAANFFHGVARPEKDPDLYFGRNVDTYLSLRSRFTGVLRARTFQWVALSLFIVPLVLTLLSEAAERLATAFWCGCLATVFGVLLLNVTTVLRTSLTRLVDRYAIRRAIHAEVDRDTQWVIARASSAAERDRGLVSQWAVSRLAELPTLPENQQTIFAQCTVVHPGWLDHHQDVMKKVDRAAGNDLASVRARFVLARRGHGLLLDDQRHSAWRILERLDGDRCRAIASALTADELDAATRQELIDHLVQVGLEAAVDACQVEGVERVWGKPLDLDSRLTRQQRVLAISHSDADAPRVIGITWDCLNESIVQRFPKGAASRCSPEQLTALANAIDCIAHEATRNALETALASTVVRATLLSRCDDEQLPFVSARRLYEAVGGATGRNRVSSEASSPVGLAAALQAAVMEAALSDDPVPPDARSELLDFLDLTASWFALFHLLEKRHRAHKGVASWELLPFYKRMDDLSWREDPPDDDCLVTALARSDIDYFVSPADMRWAVACLQQPLNLNLVAAHREHLRSSASGDFPLHVLLAWRATVGSVVYSWATPTFPDDVPVWEQEDIKRAVRQAAHMLADLPGRRDHILLANMGLSE